MALGFGFNKQKVLASAEKYVQQGKLQNAISEYEKVAEKDAKDLTVLNTIGDLYARLGQNERAGEYFKRVGDTYASDGFTVKAIAMYKKLTKLNPGAISVIQRLAEFYTQQGLYNDARQQYLQLADSFVKSNDLNGASRVFQKMLDMDPDNVSLQSKLADLFVKMGKKTEARDIFMRAATSLYERGSVDQADQALNRMLTLDPSNVEALLMRGKIAIDAGDGAAAIPFLEKVPDIDSRADGLQALLRAHILTSDGEQVEGIARKLASVHNDLSGVRAYADFLLASGKSEAALTVYDEYVDRLVVGDTGELTLALQGLTGQLKESPPLLEKLRAVFQKAGATANIPEVNELLAHACVKAGDLAKARELYKELAELEPSNPQHMQNYRQVMARMGDEPTARALDPGEGAQALFIEEIDTTPPPPLPDYPAAIVEKISNVLTDSELFESYNKPQQALSALESVLDQAPRDVRINQRLVSLYGRLGHADKAARCCDVLNESYQEAGMADQARKYADLAVRIRESGGIAAPEPLIKPMPVVPAPAPAPVKEAKVEAPPPVLPAVPIEAGEAHEIDLSSEWEAVEEPGAAVAEFEVAPAEVHPSVISDLIEEIKFYLAQGMVDEARSAVARLEQKAPDAHELDELKLQLQSEATAPPAQVEEVAVDVEEQEEAPPLPAAEADEGIVVDVDFEAELSEEVEAAEVEAVSAETPEAELKEVAPSSFEVTPPPAEEVAAPEMEVVAPPAEEFAVAPAEESPAEEVEVEEPEVVASVKEVELEAPAEEVAEAPSPIAAEVFAEPAAERDVISDLVLDLEDALGEDFGQPAVAAAVAAAGTEAQPVSIPAMAASAAPLQSPLVAPSHVPVMTAESPVSETSSVLSDLFAEFKEEVGEAAEEAEDPETHYNLGVAFKEMGLLDEAIGELQKVCKAIDRGAEFSQVMQAYTWLANCFIEKGVPEAGIKWYEKALTIPASEESRTALHYDLASAYEAAGDRPLALKHFTEVYGTNIDYRDVAQRIKALKS